jgi:hypothetical protein
MATELERRQNELVRGREEYEKAQVQIAKVSPWIVMDLYEIVSRYNPGDDVNKAIWVLAQAAQVINAASVPFKTVVEYERKKSAIKKASGG